MKKRTRKTKSDLVYDNIKQLLDAIEFEASENTVQELQDRFVAKDDLGEWWYFNGYNIKMLGDDSGEDGGYDCISFADGVQVLKKNGYITHE